MTGRQWQERAACRDLDPALLRTGASRKATERALALCRTCPVVDPCLEAALEDPAGTLNRIAGAATPLQRTHIAAVQERAAIRARSPRLGAAYRDLWEGHTAPTAGVGPDRRAAARHLIQDQRSAHLLGQDRMVAAAAAAAGRELMAMLATGDTAGVDQVLAGLPLEHRTALLLSTARALLTHERTPA